MSDEQWDDSELARVAILAREARAAAGADARLFAVRAPGRVNLIGEHTDYSGLPVLPIAIDRSTIIVAAASSTREIALNNADRSYPPRVFAPDRKIPPHATGDWANYVKAAVQGVIDHFAARGVDADAMRGARMFIDGRVPAAAGLSSSAALTVSAALAFMAVNGLELPAIETAAMVARSEWYVGTMAGGMDQAASILGQRDHALFIEFDPLRARAVKMPSDAALPVADSRETADKSGKVRTEYNRRVVECRLAARFLAAAAGFAGVRILGDVIRQAPDWNAAALVAALRQVAPKRIAPDLVNAARLLGVPHDELAREILGEGATRIVLDPTRPLEVLRRARHVLSETERVIRAARVLEAGALDEMGALMNASHRSLAEDFECSTARLDAMVECARRAGALGARLTGAGFGGSIVALCRSGDAARVIEALDREYYEPLGIASEPARAILHASPGASVMELAAV
ncbi:MAG: galactokinase [Candidatus Binataceae bacterium]